MASQESELAEIKYELNDVDIEISDALNMELLNSDYNYMLLNSGQPSAVEAVPEQQLGNGMTMTYASLEPLQLLELVTVEAAEESGSTTTMTTTTTVAENQSATEALQLWYCPTGSDTELSPIVILGKNALPAGADTNPSKPGRRRGRKVNSEAAPEKPKRVAKRKHAQLEAEQEPEPEPEPLRLLPEEQPFINPLDHEVEPKVIVLPARQQWNLEALAKQERAKLERAKQERFKQELAKQLPKKQPAKKPLNLMPPLAESSIKPPSVEQKKAPAPEPQAESLKAEAKLTEMPAATGGEVGPPAVPSQPANSDVAQLTRYLVIKRVVNGQQQNVMLTTEQLKSLRQTQQKQEAAANPKPKFKLDVEPEPPEVKPKPVEPFKHTYAMPSILKQKSQRQLLFKVQQNQLDSVAKAKAKAAAAEAAEAAAAAVAVAAAAETLAARGVQVCKLSKLAALLESDGGEERKGKENDEAIEPPASEADD